MAPKTFAGLRHGIILLGRALGRSMISWAELVFHDVSSVSSMSPAAGTAKCVLLSAC